MQNLFLCLCTTLMDVDNQNHFRSCEGIELMIRFLKENKYAASCACRVITFAVSNNRCVFAASVFSVAVRRDVTVADVYMTCAAGRTVRDSFLQGGSAMSSHFLWAAATPPPARRKVRMKNWPLRRVFPQHGSHKSILSFHVLCSIMSHLIIISRVPFNLLPVTRCISLASLTKGNRVSLNFHCQSAMLTVTSCNRKRHVSAVRTRYCPLIH